MDVYSLWYLDNGANNHMCECNNKFLELNEVIENLSLGDLLKLKIEGEKYYSIFFFQRWES